MNKFIKKKKFYYKICRSLKGGETVDDIEEIRKIYYVRAMAQRVMKKMASENPDYKYWVDKVRKTW